MLFFCIAGSQFSRSIFIFLVACYATLHPAMVVHRSVGWSVGWSVGPILLFRHFWAFWAFWACGSCPDALVTFSSTAPAQPHATRVPVYPYCRSNYKALQALHDNAVRVCKLSHRTRFATQPCPPTRVTPSELTHSKLAVSRRTRLSTRLPCTLATNLIPPTHAQPSNLPLSLLGCPPPTNLTLSPHVPITSYLFPPCPTQTYHTTAKRLRHLKSPSSSQVPILYQHPPLHPSIGLSFLHPRPPSPAHNSNVSNHREKSEGSQMTLEGRKSWTLAEVLFEMRCQLSCQKPEVLQKNEWTQNGCWQLGCVQTYEYKLANWTVTRSPWNKKEWTQNECGQLNCVHTCIY